jgi:hypothetical protein
VLAVLSITITITSTSTSTTGEGRNEAHENRKNWDSDAFAPHCGAT